MQFQKTGVAPPPLLRIPKLKQGDLDYLEAFDRCSRSRQAGGMGGPSPLMISEIGAYLSLVGIDTREERLKYLRLIQRLDGVWLDHAAEQMKAANNKKKP